MSNTRTSSAIQFKNYNGRGMFPHQALGMNKNLIREPAGTLWALIAKKTNVIELSRSVDNGFSWQELRDMWFAGDTRAVDVDPNGFIGHIGIFPKWDSIVCWQAVKNDTTYEINYSYAKLSSDLTNNSNWTEKQLATLGTTAATVGAHVFTHNTDVGALVYVSGANQDMIVRNWLPYDAATVGTAYNYNTLNFFPYFDAKLDANSIVHIIAVVDEGANPDTIRYASFNMGTNTFSSWTTIDTVPGASDSLVSLSIDIDSYGTIGVVWGENLGSDSTDWRYAYSTNSGSSFTKVDVTKASGNTRYKDTAKTTNDTRTEILASSSGGFLITFTQKNPSSVAKSYVVPLTTTNGTTYTLGSPELVAPVGATKVVCGAKFFRSPGELLQDLSNPSLIRMAWQVREATGVTQQDTSFVTFDQDVLSVSAFPSLIGSGEAFSADSLDAGEAPVNLNLLIAPTRNVDFYSEGLTGPFTSSYLNAFNKIGISCNVLKYDPLETAETGDISSYKEPIKYMANVLWDVQSYKNPTPNVATKEDQTDRIEQDIRKVYITPNFHLSREMIRNDGNFLKRTVWTIFYDGNEYELTQVVPHFINNQICYYESNAYVIGPSRDPFARKILPSET